MAAPEQATGTVVTFGLAAYAATLRVSNLTFDVDTEAVETTHLGTTVARDFIQGDLINTIISMDVQFDAVKFKANPPWDAAPQTIGIDFRGVGATGTFTVTGFVASSSIVANVPNELSTIALVFQCTSAIT